MTSRDDSLPDSLLNAIGRVATASARLEGALRYVVGKLSGDDDAGWLLLEGQSTDWLISNGTAMLNLYTMDEDGAIWPLGTYGPTMRRLFKDAESLKNERNCVIHGQWSRDCLFGSDADPEACEPHSPGSAHDGELYHVVRSRYRRGLKEEAWSVNDIETLAYKIDALARQLRDTYKASRDSMLAMYDQG